MKKVIRRPSPALVLAIVALIAALGGTAFAKGHPDKKADKKLIKSQINKLAPGLSVGHATTANSANTVGGLSFGKFDYRAAANSSTVTIATFGNVVLLGECPSGTTDLFATSNGPTLVFKSSNISEGDDPTDNSDDNLDAGEFEDLNFNDAIPGLDEVSGTFDSVSPGGSVTTGQFGTEDGEFADCQAFGTGQNS